VATPNSHQIFRQGSQLEGSQGEQWESSNSVEALSVELETTRGSTIGDNRDLPCILFEASPSLAITSVSENITDVFGVNRRAVLSQPFFLHDRVATEDRLLFQDKLRELAANGFTSFVHRFTAASELPLWVAHSLRMVHRNGEPLVHGCLVPIRESSRLLALDQEAVSRFVHKLGNHFQLLTLVVGSLKNFLPKSRESDVLTETLEKAIELTRVLSDCNQVPSWVSQLQLLDVVRAAIGDRSAEFVRRGVRLQSDLKGIPDDAYILGSPYLLEVAFGHLLQNALEATGDGGLVEFSGYVKVNGSQNLAWLCIKDRGSGIPARDKDQVTLPFFTTKKGRDGLGLTLASRFIEMQGGGLKITSVEGEGTDVAIVLPLQKGRDAACA